MEIRRYLLSEIPIEEIEPLIKDSFFASTGFLNLWRVRGGVAVWWAVSRGGSIVAALPGVEFGRGPFRRFYSTPNGCYGRLCYGPTVEEEEKVNIARKLMGALADAGYIKVFISDFYSCFAQGHGFEIQSYKTRLIDISNPEWYPSSKQLRKEIRHAEKENLSIEPFNAEKHFIEFLRLEKHSAKRLRIRQKYSRAFFHALADLSTRDDRVQWVWCEHQGRAVSSSIFLVEGDNLLSWQIYFDSSLSRLQATKLVRFMTARRLARKGVRYLNMGVSHAGATGVEEFKRRWGGEEYEYRGYVRKTLLGRLL